MDDLPAVQSLWIGGNLSRMEITSINSFMNKGHDYHLYTFGKVENIPEGVENKNARSIITDKSFNYSNPKQRANLSDIFRYKLLREKGGIWVDTDIVCVRPFVFEEERIFASERVQRQNRLGFDVPEKPTNCVMKFQKGSNVMEYCYEETKNKNPKNVEWTELGPKMVKKAVQKFNLKSSVFPFWKFCPISPWKWKDFITKSTETKIKEKVKRAVLRPYSYHLWNSQWSRCNVDKDIKYSTKTIYGKMQDKNL